MRPQTRRGGKGAVAVAIAYGFFVVVALGAAEAQEAPPHSFQDVDPAGAVDGIQLELPEPRLRLRLRDLEADEIVVVGSRRRLRSDDVASPMLERQRRITRGRCSLAIQSRGEGDPMRPQLEDPESVCGR